MYDSPLKHKWFRFKRMVLEPKFKNIKKWFKSLYPRLVYKYPHLLLSSKQKRVARKFFMSGGYVKISKTTTDAYKRYARGMQ